MLKLPCDTRHATRDPRPATRDTRHGDTRRVDARLPAPGDQGIDPGWAALPQILSGMVVDGFLRIVVSQRRAQAFNTRSIVTGLFVLGAGIVILATLTLRGTTDLLPPTPKPTHAPASSAAPKVVRLTPSVSAAQFVAAVQDNTTDVIELAGGTYRPGVIRLNVDRTRPVIIRPAARATAVFSGVGSQSAFWLGFGGVAGEITFDGLVFDGFTIGTTGLFDLGHAHDITMNNIVVRNVTGPVAYSQQRGRQQLDRGRQFPHSRRPYDRAPPGSPGRDRDRLACHEHKLRDLRRRLGQPGQLSRHQRLDDRLVRA